MIATIIAVLLVERSTSFKRNLQQITRDFGEYGAIASLISLLTKAEQREGGENGIMRTKTLSMMIVVAFLLVGVAGSSTVFAPAETWYHDVIRDVGRDTATIEIPPDMQWISEWTWNSHLVYNDVFDAGGNLHVNYKYASTAKVHNVIWRWNGEEWVIYTEWSQRLNTIGGNNELIIDFFTETQTARQIDIYNERYQMVFVDPVTGEETTYEYTIIAHLMLKWLNGELQFEIDWEIMRPET